MTFNLDAPPGFRGLDPEKKIEVYTRNLPHWRQAGATYFVTFNLADALPGPKKAELKSIRREWELRNPPPRDEETLVGFARTVFQTVEKWMDAGYGKCWLRDATNAAELHRSILHFHAQRDEVGCFVIMANHCHLVIRPLDPFTLESEVGSMKSVTASFISKRQAIEGSLWQQESYDRIIRDEEHLFRVVQYVGSNPRRAGIPEQAWRRWINPNWKATGRDFHDEK